MGLWQPGPVGAAPRVVARGALLAALDSPAWLTSVVAGPGSGKTTLLTGWAADRGAAYRALGPGDSALPVLLRTVVGALHEVPATVAEACADPGGDDGARATGVAALLATALADGGVPQVVVLDDLQHVPGGSAAMRFVEALCRHAPRGLRLVLGSRSALPFRVDRLRAAGLLAEVGVDELVFAEDETYQVLAAALADAAAADVLAPDLHLVTSGWPALVGLAANWLAQAPKDGRAARLRQLGTAVDRGPGAEVDSVTGGLPASFNGLVGTLLAVHPPAEQDILRYAAHLPVIDSALADALDIAEHLPAIPPFLEAAPGRTGWLAVPGGLRDIVRSRLVLPDDERSALLAAAVVAYAGRGLVSDALDVARLLDEPEVTTVLLAGHGAALIAAGRAADVAAEAARLASPDLDLLEGEARHTAGDLAGAVACFERLTPAGGPLQAGLARRIGHVFHSAGRLDAALAVYERGTSAGPAADVALLLARRSGIHWLRGDDNACRDLAGRALEAAEASGDDHARAAAHNAVAGAAERDGDWDGHAYHVEAALAAAIRAGDLLSQLTTRVSSAARLLEQSRYAGALVELDESMRLVEATGAGERRAIVQINRGWAYRGLGRLDEAVAEFEAARRIWHDAGSALEAYAQIGLGAVYLVRGDLAEAETVLGRAVESAERTGDAQSWAALTTLCRVRYATDPLAAERMADRALATNTGLWRVWALLSKGWIALHRGDHAEAEARAAEAGDVIARRSDHTAEAELYELRALLSPDPAERTRLLQEAQVRYTRIGNGLFVARTAAALVANGDNPPAVVAAEARLRALGIRPAAARAAGLLKASGLLATAPSTEDGLDAMRGLAAAAIAHGLPAVALRWYLRVLERAPDDEAGHLGAVSALVRDGRPDEAHRRYRSYADRMRDRGAEPAPFPG
jgi:ATP/maltotriose-dependent transcriptional regulator MalT